jgi:hypothetical protein
VFSDWSPIACLAISALSLLWLMVADLKKPLSVGALLFYSLFSNAQEVSTKFLTQFHSEPAAQLVDNEQNMDENWIFESSPTAVKSELVTIISIKLIEVMGKSYKKILLKDFSSGSIVGTVLADLRFNLKIGDKMDMYGAFNEQIINRVDPDNYRLFFDNGWCWHPLARKYKQGAKYNSAY